LKPRLRSISVCKRSISRLLKLDHLTSLKVDQVVMVLSSSGLVAGATVAEFVALKDAFGLQTANGSVDRRQANAGLPANHAAV